MMRDAFEPLRSLLDAPAIDEIGWRERAIQTCWETVQIIDRIQRERAGCDRDTGAFLDALRHSLEWVLAEQATSEEISRVVMRANRVLASTTLTAH